MEERLHEFKNTSFKKNTLNPYNHLQRLHKIDSKNKLGQYLKEMKQIHSYTCEILNMY